MLKRLLGQFIERIMSSNKIEESRHLSMLQANSQICFTETQKNSRTLNYKRKKRGKEEGQRRRLTSRKSIPKLSPFIEGWHNIKKEGKPIFASSQTEPKN